MNHNVVIAIVVILSFFYSSEAFPNLMFSRHSCSSTSFSLENRLKGVQSTQLERTTNCLEELHYGHTSKSITLQEKKEINWWRITFIGAVVAIGFHQKFLDQMVQNLWVILTQKSWFRHDMFEPVLSVSSFFVWIHGWLLVDTLATNEKSPKFFKNLRKYRLQDQSFHKKREKIISDAEINEIVSTQQEPDSLKLNKWYKGWVWELIVYLVPLWAIAEFTDIFAPRRMALAWAAPSFNTVVLQILGGLFMYDFFFFFGHFLMHNVSKSFFRTFHGKHHVNSEVRAADTVRLTVVEEVVDVLCSIAGLRLLRAHPISRAIYDIVITFLLVELHCGYSMPWSPQNLMPSVFAGSKRHHLHHKFGNVYFQKFFRYLDDSMNFVKNIQLKWKPSLAYA